MGRKPPVCRIYLTPAEQAEYLGNISGAQYQDWFAYDFQRSALDSNLLAMLYRPICPSFDTNVTVLEMDARHNESHF